MLPLPYRHAGWAVTLLIDFGNSWPASRSTTASPPGATHFPERFGLLTIILLGEFVASVMRGIESQNLIPLSEQQCRSLSCSSNPNPVLEEVIANPKHELDFILRSGFANATYNKNKYHTGRQLWTYGGNSRTSKHGVVGCVRF
ncbi:MAG: hypothetical protein DME58_05530 [Verrucomicrobia bacterium]|nr:MAG: hypothetical protein DME58_05530 [Verrucomicrobiota bacterium]